jgi:hypothetical protein
MTDKLRKPAVLSWVAVLLAIGLACMASLAIANSQGSSAEPQGSGLEGGVISIGATEVGWEKRVRKDLADRGFPAGDVDVVIEKMKTQKERLNWNHEHRGLLAAADPVTWAPSTTIREWSNDSQYVGCGVSGRGNALIDVYDPTSVVAYWTGLYLLPPFTYTYGPLFQACNDYACLFYTWVQGTGRWSHTVSVTVDTDVEISDSWCS